MWSRLSLRSSSNTGVLRRNIARSRPTRGGAGHQEHHDLHHYHGNKKLGPYEVPHHPAYPHEAHPFGIDFSKGYKAEGWELTTALVYSIMFGMFVYHTYDEKRDDDFGVRDERCDSPCLRQADARGYLSPRLDRPIPG